MRLIKAKRLVALFALVGFSCGSVWAALAVPSVDQENPTAPDGTPIPLSKNAGNSADMCFVAPTDHKFVTGEFGEMAGHASKPHHGTDIRARMGEPIYSPANGCVSFGNPTAKQLVGVKIKIDDKYPNSSVWYLHMSRVVPKFINDGRQGICIPVEKGELVGYSGHSYGTGGVVREGDAANAHLHLSYFVSGLMINPMPYDNPQSDIDPVFNTIMSGDKRLYGAVESADSNSSGTKGTKMGFAVPRMCDIFTVLNKGASRGKTIPYNGDFGDGVYRAQKSAPSKEEIESAQEKIRKSFGIGSNGKAPQDQLIDAHNWTGGMPEMPDWDSYDEMSLNQIIHSEVSRRADNRWNEGLTQMDERGLFIETIWLKALRMKIMSERLASKQRIDALYAAILAEDAKVAAYQASEKIESLVAK